MQASSETTPSKGITFASSFNLYFSSMRSLDELNDTDQTTICNFNISQGIDPVSTHTKNTNYVLTKAKRQSPLITCILITLCVCPSGKYSLAKVINSLPPENMVVLKLHRNTLGSYTLGYSSLWYTALLNVINKMQIEHFPPENPFWKPWPTKIEFPQFVV